MNSLFELSILDSYSPDYAIALARCGSDIAIRKIPFGAELDRLISFSANILGVLNGTAFIKRPDSAEVVNFGHSLFNFVLREDLLRLYNRLPETHVTLNVLTNQTRIRQLPWEYLQEPQGQCPRAGRSVVRLVPNVGGKAFQPLAKDGITRVLLIAADPVGLRDVDWEDVKMTLERTYRARTGDANLDLKVVEGGTRQSLTDAVLNHPCDIVHFSCHGAVVKDVGRLILKESNSNRADHIDARELGTLLADRNIRLVILSACETSTTKGQGDFANIAETLIRQGIPAVVANQAPARNKTTAAFVGALYRELLSSGNIDKAMTAGRIALCIELRGDPEWGIPTLHRLHGADVLYS